MIMKNILLVLALALSAICFGQTREQRTFLFVHGAWGGGWEYAKIDSILSAKGDKVFHPTLTGLGERVHLANPAIDLSTHIADIVNVIKFEGLQNLILVGHSYGGMVISGVAEKMPERIRQLIYVDAFVPDDGESVKTILGPYWDGVEKAVKDGFVSYLYGPTKSIPPTDVPQPLRTFTESIKIANPLVIKIPSAYILMTKQGKADYDQAGASKARIRRWEVLTLEGGHYPMREQPAALVEKIEIILK